jgi:bacillolysin
MKRIFYTIVVIIACLQLCLAQENNFVRRPDITVFKEVSELGWVKFQDNYITNPEKVFEVNKTAFGLSENFQMKLLRKKDDDYGYTHIKFQQTYNNVTVLGGEYFIHAKNGKTYTGNGKIFTPQFIKSSFILTEQAALNFALLHINAKTYYWQDPKREARLKRRTKNLTATYFPKAGMAYVLSADSNTLLLCYSFIIKTNEFGKSAICYIDASNGDLVKKDLLDNNCDQTSVTTNWYGIRTIYTNDVAVIGNSYDLEDDCQSSVFGVYDATNDDDIFNTGDNVWANDWQRSAATSLWSIKESYLWYRTFFGRPGHDDDDGNLDIYQGFNFGANGGTNNASYSYDPIGDDEIKIGIGNTPSVPDDYNTVDILAHEFTHGVIRYEAQLGGEKDPGALGESFGDIFGEWIESKVFGGTNWIIGWDRDQTNCNRILRYLVDPGGQSVNIGSGCTRNFNLPNTYLGSNWVSTTAAADPGDKWGIHINCGVQNQMFYLLSAGGSGWNNGQTSHAPVNTGFFWNVASIGIDKAIRIAYKVINDYLTSGSSFRDARNAWVQAAENIFGTCSFEAIQTGRAWAAAGIGPPVLQTLFVCNETYGSAPYTAVVTPKNITTNAACAVTVLSTGNLVEFKSGGKITLSPGFRSLTGSNFKATVSDCNFAAY